MTRRYFAPDLPATGGIVDLSDDEARHASRVMRAQVGDSVTLFDGCGNESSAVIHAIDKRNCVVEAEPAAKVDREAMRTVRLGIAFPKPERSKELIERLTELGVTEITPLVCDRTQRAPTDSLLTKLRRIVIESSKQCERNVLMQIRQPAALDDYLSRDIGPLRWIAHPGGQSISERCRTTAIDADITALIGPEGGFTESEVDAATNHQFDKISLGNRIFRVETAASSIAALLTC